MCKLNNLSQTLFQLNKLSAKESCVLTVQTHVHEREVLLCGWNVVYNDGLWFQQNAMTLKGLQGTETTTDWLLCY
jgi:hypothetical protein